MRSSDLYTKVVLTIIAVCLAVLCIEESHWNRLQTVQAQSGQLVISGYTFSHLGNTRVVQLGDNSPGIPVVVVNK